jgi:hypothetical protein
VRGEHDPDLRLPASEDDAEDAPKVQNPLPVNPD